jgi:H+/gluconate symporter-like permease
MFIDFNIILGLIVVIASCVMVGYVGMYACRHIKEDAARAEAEESQSNQSKSA